MPSEKLSPGERRSFQGMYDYLMSGRITTLSKKQRAWVDEAYDKHDLDKERPPARPVEVKDRAAMAADFFANMPRPLKPPGRM